MIKIGNAIIDESTVVEAHANMKKNYLKVTFLGGASIIYNADVLQNRPDYALNELHAAIWKTEKTPVTAPEADLSTKKDEKLSLRDVMLMNVIQSMNQQKQG